MAPALPGPADDGWPMTPEDDLIYQDIIQGRHAPLPEHFQAGRAAHAGGKGFHESPHPMFSLAGISWRIGWNEAALDADSIPRRS